MTLPKGYGRGGGKVNKKEKLKDQGEFEVVSQRIMTEVDTAVMEFAKNSVVNSVDTMKNFAQAMVTLVSGLFAVYFALLKFLGIETVTSATIPTLKTILALPPTLFILSLIAFVLAVFPLHDKVAYTPTDIKNVRARALRIKYVCVTAGLVLFLTALAFTIMIFLGV